MIELSAIVCLVIGGCKDISLVFGAESVTPMQCMMQSQTMLAKWTNEHPGWQVKRWSCGIVGRYARA